jgi:hypothetical protein
MTYHIRTSRRRALHVGRLWQLLIPLLLASAPAHAQTTQRVSDPRAFALEALGGSAGSLVGIGAVGIWNKCGVEDLRCLILKAGASGLAGAAGATIGTTLSARYTGAKRSVAGAALGAVVGTGAGLGIHYLVTRAGGGNLGDNVVAPIVILSQGILSTAGSRLLGKRR